MIIRVCDRMLKYFFCDRLKGFAQIFLIKNNDLYRAKENFIYDRSSTIPPIFNSIQVKIYSGNHFNTKNVNLWMVGYKFGEFTWNRKLALYKAKQLKKKTKK